MDVLGFGDKPHFLTTGNALLIQREFVFGIVMAIDEKQLVFIQLNFHGLARVQNGNAAAAIVQLEVF